MNSETRNAEIIRLRNSKWPHTLQDIARKFGITRERVRQIILHDTPEWKAKMIAKREARELVRDKKWEEIAKLRVEKDRERALRRATLPVATYEWQMKGRERTRSIVRFRDHYTCQDCGKVRTPREVEEHNSRVPGKGPRPGLMKSFDVHHLGGICGQKSRGYDSIDAVPILITLCHQCHFRRHDFSKKAIAARHAPKPRKTHGNTKESAHI